MVRVVACSFERLLFYRACSPIGKLPSAGSPLISIINNGGGNNDV